VAGTFGHTGLAISKASRFILPHAAAQTKKAAYNQNDFFHSYRVNGNPCLIRSDNKK